MPGEEFLDPTVIAAQQGRVDGVSPEDAQRIIDAGKAIGDHLGIPDQHWAKLTALAAKAASPTQTQASTGTTATTSGPDAAPGTGGALAGGSTPGAFGGTGGLDALGGAMLVHDQEEAEHARERAAFQDDLNRSLEEGRRRALMAWAAVAIMAGLVFGAGLGLITNGGGGSAAGPATSTPAPPPKPQAMNTFHSTVNGQAAFTATPPLCTGFAPSGTYGLGVAFNGSNLSTSVDGAEAAPGTIDADGHFQVQGPYYSAQGMLNSNGKPSMATWVYSEGSHKCPYSVLITMPALAAPPPTQAPTAAPKAVTTAAAPSQPPWRDPVVLLTVFIFTAVLAALGLRFTWNEDGTPDDVVPGPLGLIGPSPGEDVIPIAGDSATDGGGDTGVAALLGAELSPDLVPEAPEGVVEIKGDSAPPPPDEVM